MGALPSDKAGVGSAVNDTTSSAARWASRSSARCSPASAAAMLSARRTWLPQAVVEPPSSPSPRARRRQGLPADLAADVTAAAQQSPSTARSRSLVAGAVAAIGSVVALVLLPARHAAPAVPSEPAMVDAVRRRLGRHGSVAQAAGAVDRLGEPSAGRDPARADRVRAKPVVSCSSAPNTMPSARPSSRAADRRS